MEKSKRAGASPVNAVVRETIMERQVHFQSSDRKWTCLLRMFCVCKQAHSEVPAPLTRLGNTCFGPNKCFIVSDLIAATTPSSLTLSVQQYSMFIVCRTQQTAERHCLSVGHPLPFLSKAVTFLAARVTSFDSKNDHVNEHDDQQVSRL